MDPYAQVITAFQYNNSARDSMGDSMEMRYLSLGEWNQN